MPHYRGQNIATDKTGKILLFAGLTSLYELAGISRLTASGLKINIDMMPLLMFSTQTGSSLEAHTSAILVP